MKRSICSGCGPPKYKFTHINYKLEIAVYDVCANIHYDKVCLIDNISSHRINDILCSHIATAIRDFY
jgi:hypothetical protein